MLELDTLKMRFGGFYAVDGCSFRVETGSITGLIGPNGAGKTTVFNMIAGALKPSSGNVRFNGRDVTGFAPHELFRLGVVRTFQIPHEFARLTVIENLMTVPPGQPGEKLRANWAFRRRVRGHEAEIRERAQWVLDFLELSHLRDERAGNLSGGQKKLLELGRTMMTDAKLVLLDEPAAGVNRTLLKKLIENIKRLNTELGYTFCVIEHDMDMIADLCDPVICMAQGSVLTQGAFADVRADPRVLEAYLGEPEPEEAVS
ncbi:MAG: ABC transporter ATP-binding protein [Hyphomicrobiales bacterium]|nr:ABC transporter ATP-binding protein [Hyphomicrobiales bacterium]